MRKLYFLLLGIMFSPITSNAQAVDTLYGTLTTDRLLCSDTTYILKEGVFVDNGVTLTIDPGTIIKATEGDLDSASFLVIARGAKLIANGTPSQPIIFTTVLDSISKDHPNYPGFVNTTIDDIGLWGGIMILGNAPIHTDAGTELQIEGIPIENPNGLYGGDNSTDNSGLIQYVSVRHGGVNIGGGNEVTSFSLSGVGSNTIIDHIETIASKDDGIEIFGGNVNLEHIISINAGDDAIDVDQGYAGTLNNFIVYGPSDACLELDGPELDDYEVNNFKLSNGTAFVQSEGGQLCDTDPNTNVNMDSVFWFGLSTNDYETGKVFTELPSITFETPTFSNFQAAIPAGESISDYFLEGSETAAIDVTIGDQTVGANICEFTSWTATYTIGLLTEDFVINPVGCSDTASSNYCPYAPISTNCRYDFVYDCSTILEVDDIDQPKVELSIFPNPNQGEFNIHLSQDLLNTKYVIYNSLGQPIETGKIENTNQVINGTSWEKGLYILLINTKEQVFTEKIVLN